MLTLNERHRLGRKTYWLFFLKNSVGAILFFGAAILFLILSSIGSETLTGSLNLTNDGVRTAQAFLVLGLLATSSAFILLGAISAIWTWYEYKSYTFILDDHALEVSRGIITKENISIPYHHIEDINLEQSLFYQMIGVCRLVIMTAGRGTNQDDYQDQSEGILPAIDIEMGHEIQKTIMKRSNYQEVINVNPSPEVRPPMG